MLYAQFTLIAPTVEVESASGNGFNSITIKEHTDDYALMRDILLKLSADIGEIAEEFGEED